MSGATQPHPVATPASRPVLAIRGATTIEHDTVEEVSTATHELLLTLMHRNGLHPDDLISAWFTCTADITADFPARTARDQLEWHDVPMLCATEMAVKGAMARVIRVMVHAVPHGALAQHTYLRGAAALRPDLAATPS
jgi:chorismate mutase